MKAGELRPDDQPVAAVAAPCLTGLRVAVMMPDQPTGVARPASHLPAATDCPGFGFADAAAIADYLAELGVTHAYLSPILQAAPGSAHGYDVVDHSQISAELGGEDGFRAMAARYAECGIGIVVDVVPNHMAVPAPEYLNRQLWSVLRDGRDSPLAHWFDIDWDAAAAQLLLPILAKPLHECLDGSGCPGSANCPDPAVTDGEDGRCCVTRTCPASAARHRAACRCPSC